MKRLFRRVLGLLFSTRVGVGNALQRLEAVWFKARVGSATIWTICRYGHYFERIGKSSCFVAPPEFDPYFAVFSA